MASLWLVLLQACGQTTDKAYALMLEGLYQHTVPTITPKNLQAILATAPEKPLLLDTRQPWAIYLAVALGLAGGHALLYSVQAALIPELFGTRLRCTGASLGYQLAAPLAGGLAPMIAATLVEVFPGEHWPLATYIVALAAISLVCVWRLAETSRKQLGG